MELQNKLMKLKERHKQLKIIDDIMQSRDRVEDRQRQRTLRIIDLKILILMDKTR